MAAQPLYFGLQAKGFCMSDFIRTLKRYTNEMKSSETHRFHSWDFCHQAFSPKSSSDKDAKALHLGFYLASWGMMRGSSELLNKNYKVHLGLIEPLAEFEEIYNVNLTKASGLIEKIFGAAEVVKAHYAGNGISPTDTLVTKVLLGTLGCVPAYDRFFKDGLRKKGINCSTFETSFPALIKHCHEFDFDGARVELGNSNYPDMKLIDMYFWQLGKKGQLPRKGGSESR